MSNMSYNESFFIDNRGLKFFYRFWKTSRAKKTLVFFHALGLHTGRYAWLLSELVSRGISCYALDLYGHGLSDGPRGGGNLNDLRSLASKFVSFVLAKAGSKKLVLAGHGIGTLLAVETSLTSSFDSVLLVSPFTEVLDCLQPCSRLKVAAFLGLRVPIRLAPIYDVSHRDAVAEAREDPLVYRYASSRIVLPAVRSVASVINLRRSITVAEEECFSALRKVLPEGLFNAENRWLTYNPEREIFPLDSIAETLEW